MIKSLVFIALIAAAVAFVRFHQMTGVKSLENSLWPLPFRVKFDQNQWSQLNNSLSLEIQANDTANVQHLQQIWKIYESIIFESTPDWLSNQTFEPRGVLERVEVIVSKPSKSKYPTIDSDESYRLEIKPNSARIESAELWGAIRAFETLSQLVRRSESQLFVAQCSIDDTPRFPYRGLHVDTARHFLAMSTLKKHLDAMMHSKLNVLHWHLVDDESFSYQSDKYPELSAKASFYPNITVYTKEDIAEIVEYARLRGIRVIPELDSPDHTKSWGVGRPDFLTQCSADNPSDRRLVDISNPDVWTFLEDILKEFKDRFPDNCVHLGGDEVRLNCWMRNAKIAEYMQKLGFGSDYKKLLMYYFGRLAAMAAENGKTTIFWDEVADLKKGLNDNQTLSTQNTIFHIWRSSTDYVGLIEDGYRVILSFPWYLDLISYGEDWLKYYRFEPLAVEATPQQKSLVIGGESCTWAEFIDDTNAISRTWPRAAAMAERLWSHKFDDIEPRERIDRFRCLLVSRNINAQPVVRYGLQCPPSQGK